MLKKILIANRGEIACRVIKTARRMGIRTVAVYSEADRDALHVELADEAVCIGPAPSRESYLVMDNIIAACKQTGADGRPSRLRLPLRERGVSRAGSRKRASSSSAPSTRRSPRWATRSPVEEARREAGSTRSPATTRRSRAPTLAVEIARKIGYPVMIKASAGGGGKGLRVAHDDTEAAEGFASCRNEAKASFGDDRVFIEKFVEEPRHIEIQVLGDAHGHCVYLWERECSIQRRHQKVVEEAPSPFLDDATRKAMGEQAVALAQGRRLPVGGHRRVRRRRRQELLLPRDEHAPAGRASGDGVDHRHRPRRADDPRRRPASRCAFAQGEIARKGWAIECRINAEDPLRGFLPSTGRLVTFRPPAQTLAGRRAGAAGTPGVRVDTGVYEGGEIAIHYDSMICKLIAVGCRPRRRDRDDARRAQRLRDPRRLEQPRASRRRCSATRASPPATSTPASSPRNIREGFGAVTVGARRPRLPSRPRGRLRAAPARALGRPHRPAAGPRARARRALRRRRDRRRRPGRRRRRSRSASTGATTSSRSAGRTRRVAFASPLADIAVHGTRRRRAVPCPGRARRALAEGRPRRRAHRGARAHAARRRAQRADAVQAAARSLALPALADAGPARRCRGQGRPGGAHRRAARGDRGDEDGEHRHRGARRRRRARRRASRATASRSTRSSSSSKARGGGGMSASTERPFHVLGVQQVAIGARSKARAAHALGRQARPLAHRHVSLRARERRRGHLRHRHGPAPGRGRPDGADRSRRQARRPRRRRSTTSASGSTTCAPPSPGSRRTACGWRRAASARGAAGHDICFIHPKANDAFPVGGRGRADRAGAGAAPTSIAAWRADAKARRVRHDDPRDPEDGRPAPAARRPAGRALRHARAARARRRHVRDHARGQRRRPRRAADRRRPAAGDLRLQPQRALSGCAGRCRRRCSSIRSSSRSTTSRKKAGKAACRCPACAASCRAGRASAIAASTSRAGRSSARPRAFMRASSSTSAITCVGILYPMRVRDFSRFGFTSVLFPDLDPGADD